jgi:hypothetical protein
VIKAVEDIKRVQNTVNLVLEQTGQNAKGPGSAKPPASGSSTEGKSSVQLAVENAKYAVDTTRSNLETARKSYEDASDRLVQGQQAMTSAIAEITKVALEGATLESEYPPSLFLVIMETEVHRQRCYPS